MRLYVVYKATNAVGYQFHIRFTKAIYISHETILKSGFIHNLKNATDARKAKPTRLLFTFLF